MKIQIDTQTNLVTIESDGKTETILCEEGDLDSRFHGNDKETGVRDQEAGVRDQEAGARDQGSETKEERKKLEPGEAIRAWLKHRSKKDKARYSQTMMAKEAGLSTGNITYYLTGVYMPRKKTLEKIAGVFEVSVEEFLLGPPEYQANSMVLDKEIGLLICKKCKLPNANKEQCGLCRLYQFFKANKLVQEEGMKKLEAVEETERIARILMNSVNNKYDQTYNFSADE